MDDITPIWTIKVWEDINETQTLATKKFRGDYAMAVEEADRLLQYYKEMEDTFTTSHFTIE